MFNLLAIAGQAAHETALLLVRHGFDFSRAALAFGLAQQCRECAKGSPEFQRGCNRHQCALRQRAKRAVDRMTSLLPGHRSDTEAATFSVPVQRRPRIIYGADGRLGSGEAGSKLYDTLGEEDPQLEALADRLLEESAEA